jgi:hypothetical protein
MKGKNKISRDLFAGILIILFAPMLFMQLSFIKIMPLRGAITKIEKPKLTFATWFSEDFQAGSEKYLNQNFGFRNFFVRLNNQLKYTLFNTAQANGVIIGKQQYLYEESYILAYLGKDFIGEKEIAEQMRKLRTIQDSLKKHNIDIILAFAPGKGSFYPEYIPDKYDTIKSITNHQVYVEQAKLNQVNYIDFSSWFINKKDTSKYHLYPKTGIHWSYYGANIATDSLVSYIETLRVIDMPDMIWDTIEVRSESYGVDNDIEQGMNLLASIPNFAMPYPKITIRQENKTKPKAIVVADSYYWQLHNAGYSKKIFDQGEFWFYNNQVYPPRSEDGTKVKDLKLLDEIYQQDVIILMCTEPFLKRKFWGFIDDLYDEVINDDPTNRAIQEIISKILSNKEWTEEIRQKAKEKDIAFEEMLRLDAAYILKQKRD